MLQETGTIYLTTEFEFKGQYLNMVQTGLFPALLPVNLLQQ